MANIPFSAVYNHIYIAKKRRKLHILFRAMSMFMVSMPANSFLLHITKIRGELEDQMAGRKKDQTN